MSLRAAQQVIPVQFLPPRQQANSRCSLLGVGVGRTQNQLLFRSSDTGRFAFGARRGRRDLPTVVLVTTSKDVERPPDRTAHHRRGKSAPRVQTRVLPEELSRDRQLRMV